MPDPRPKRTRAQVNYVEPTELDDDIAVEDDPVEPEAAAADDPVDDQSTDSDTSGDDSDAEEFTTDKRKLKAQEKALKKKKAAKKAKKANKLKKIKNVPFPFMDLPPEIRVMIYREALVESARELTFASKYKDRDFFRGHVNKGVYRRWYGNNWKFKRERPSHPDRTSLQPVLLRVCKAIRDEALPFFYGQTFHFESPSTLQLFLGRISPANRMLLRDIVLRGWADAGNWRKDINQAFALLTAATNVRRLVLDRHIYDDNDRCTDIYGSHKLWADMQYWADAIDGVHGKGAAKNVLKFKKICFGSVNEIENKEDEVDERMEIYMNQLKLSDKPVEPAANVAGAAEEASDGSDK